MGQREQRPDRARAGPASQPLAGAPRFPPASTLHEERRPSFPDFPALRCAMRRSPAARQVRPCSASARPRDHAHPPFSYCTGVPRRVRVSHRRLEAACRSRGSAGTLSLVYSVGGHSGLLPRPAPGTVFDPGWGTVGIPQRAVGAGLAGPCSCGPGPQCPLQAARLSPSSGHLPGGPGASAEGKVGGLGKHRSPACGSEWDWVHRRGRVGGRKAPPCAQNLFYAP